MSSEQLEMLFNKLSNTAFKVWKEETPLAGEPYTVMHIESVFELLDLIIQMAAICGHKQTMNFAILLKTDIQKSIGREEEYVSN